MSCPRVRLTTRRTMVAVAIAAVILAVVQRTHQHWSYCQRRSAYHSQRLAIFSTLRHKGWEFGGTSVRFHEKSTDLGMALGLLRGDGMELVRSATESIQHHASMRDKYDLAAWRPWLPIEPDDAAP
jgi:hypothetical protein